MLQATSALTLLLLTATAAPTQAPPPNPLPAVGRLLRALGGSDAPYRVESIAFTFSVERDGQIAGSRRHHWYPRTGRHQLWIDGDGDSQTYVDWNLNTGRGTAIRNGAYVEGPELQALLERTARMWVNDTYWLLMPYKIVDPGVELAGDGECTIDGHTYDKIKLTFDDVGFTPGDTYWAYLDREDGLMRRWAFILEGQKPPAVEWRWLDWRWYGPLLLSSRKERVDAAQAILTHDIVVE